MMALYWKHIFLCRCIIITLLKQHVYKQSANIKSLRPHCRRRKILNSRREYYLVELDICVFTQSEQNVLNVQWYKLVFITWLKVSRTSGFIYLVFFTAVAGWYMTGVYYVNTLYLRRSLKVFGWGVTTFKTGHRHISTFSSDSKT